MTSNVSVQQIGPSLFTIRSQQALVWCSVVFLVVFGLSWALLIGFLPLPPATLSAREVASFYAEHGPRIRLGASLCSWTAGFYVPLYAVVAVQLARLERGFPLWALLQFGAGMMMTIFFVLPPLMWGVAAFNPARPPEVTLLMHEFANLALVATDQYFIFQMLPITVIALTCQVDAASPFPRWFGYFNLWAALVFEVGAAGFLAHTGPFAWNGLFVFWIPLATFTAWTATIIFMLLRALARQRVDVIA